MNIDVIADILNNGSSIEDRTRTLCGLAVRFDAARIPDRDEYQIRMKFNHHVVTFNLSGLIWHSVCENGRSSIVNLIYEIDKRLRKEMLGCLTG